MLYCRRPREIRTTARNYGVFEGGGEEEEEREKWATGGGFVAGLGILGLVWHHTGGIGAVALGPLARSLSVCWTFGRRDRWNSGKTAFGRGGVGAEVRE